MTTFELYFLLILPRIFIPLCMISFLAGFGLLITGIGMFIGSHDHHKVDEDLKKYGVRCIFLSVPIIILYILTFLVPTERVMLALVAWELGSSIDGLNELPSEFVEFLKLTLQAHIDAMKSTK